MNIVLEYFDPEHWPRPDGWTVVGRIGHQALAYDPDRRPHLLTDAGPEPLDPAEVNRALVAAVDAAASKLWPNGWHQAFSEVFKVSRRNLNQDRLSTRGLAPKLLQTLGSFSDSHDAEGLGWFLMAVARYVDVHAVGTSHAERIEEALDKARMAAEALSTARSGKPVFPSKDERTP